MALCQTFPARRSWSRSLTFPKLSLRDNRSVKDGFLRIVPSVPPPAGRAAPRPRRRNRCPRHRHSFAEKWETVGWFPVPVFPLNLSGKICFLQCSVIIFPPTFTGLSFRARLRVSEGEERVERPSGAAAKDVSYVSHHRHRGSANQRPGVLRNCVLLKGDQNKEPHRSPKYLKRVDVLKHAT